MNTNNENGDIDSGNENQAIVDGSILSGNQLSGSTVLQIITPFGGVMRGDEEKLSNKNEKIDNCQPKVSKQSKTNNHHANN